MNWIRNLLAATTPIFSRPSASSPVLNYGGPEDDEAAAEIGALLRDGHLTSADTQARLALDQARREHVSNNPRVATALMNLAAVHVETGNYASAKDELQQALDIRVQRFGNDDPATMRTQIKLGEWHEKHGIKAQARTYYNAVHLLVNKRVGPENAALALIHNRHASLCLCEELYDAAEVHAREAIRLSRIPGGDLKERVRGFTQLGNALNGLRSIKDALEAYREAERECSDICGVESLESANCCMDLATFLIGNYGNDTRAVAKALDYAKRAFQVRQTRLGNKHPEYAKAGALLGRLRCAAGQHDAGLRLVEDAANILTEAVGGAHPDVRSLQNLTRKLVEQKHASVRRPGPTASIALLIEQLKLGPAWIEEILSEFPLERLQRKPTPDSLTARELVHKAVLLQHGSIARLNAMLVHPTAVSHAESECEQGGAYQEPPSDDLAACLREHRRQRALLIERLEQLSVAQWYAPGEHSRWARFSTLIMLRHLALEEMQIALELEERLLAR